MDSVVDAFYGLNRWQKIAYGTVFVFGRYFRDKAVGLEVLGRYIRDQNLVEQVHCVLHIDIPVSPLFM